MKPLNSYLKVCLGFQSQYGSILSGLVLEALPKKVVFTIDGSVKFDRKIYFLGMFKVQSYRFDRNAYHKLSNFNIEID